MRTKPELHEAKDEAEARYYEAEVEAKKFGLEAMLASRTTSATKQARYPLSQNQNQWFRVGDVVIGHRNRLKPAKM